MGSQHKSQAKKTLEFMKMDAKSIAAFLKEERCRTGMSQKELSMIAGVHANTIGRFENSDTCVLDTLLKLINCFWDDMTSFAEDYDYWRENGD